MYTSKHGPVTVHCARMLSANTEALVLQRSFELNLSAWISSEGFTNICTTDYFVLPFFEPNFPKSSKKQVYEITVLNMLMCLTVSGRCNKLVDAE